MRRQLSSASDLGLAVLHVHPLIRESTKEARRVGIHELASEEDRPRFYLAACATWINRVGQQIPGNS
jgi:hypothetical protein